MGKSNIPILAATNGTLSITAEPAPNKITNKSVEIADCTSWPKVKIKPRDSSAATVIKIPRKNNIDGISILERALKTGLLE